MKLKLVFNFIGRLNSQVGRLIVQCVTFIVTGHSKTALHLRMSAANIRLSENDLTGAIVSH
jgi:hypothetical protein